MHHSWNNQAPALNKGINVGGGAKLMSFTGSLPIYTFPDLAEKVSLTCKQHRCAPHEVMAALPAHPSQNRTCDYRCKGKFAIYCITEGQLLTIELPVIAKFESEATRWDNAFQNAVGNAVILSLYALLTYKTNATVSNIIVTFIIHSITSSF